MIITSKTNILKNLTDLLSNLTPTLDPQTFAFAFTENLSKEWISNTFSVIREKEGWTIIMPEDRLPPKLIPSAIVMRKITLMVISDLEAVGLTAAVATALATHGISCNVIAAYYHDHLFVPPHHAEKALQILKQLSQQEP